MSALAAVGLKEWPFELVPPTGPTNAWFGRSDFRVGLERIFESWAFRRTSSIYLLWADFGAGKTHALRYLQAKCSNDTEPVVAVYAELPSETMDFLGVFQQIVKGIPESVLRNVVNKLREAHGADWLQANDLNGDRDTPRVLWQLSEMPDDQVGEAARKWLSGGRTSAADLKLLGGVGAIRTSNDALRVLTTIQHLIVKYGGYRRFVLLLDEFQRVGQASRARLRDVNAGLHRFFNNSPSGLSIFLSYSIGDANAIRLLVTEELMSRVEEEMALTMLSAEDGLEFIQEVIESASITGKHDEIIGTSVLLEVVERIAQDSGGRLTPRRLMQVFGGIFERIITSTKHNSLPIDSATAQELYRKPVADQY